jgi:hypothetical protein
VREAIIDGDGHGREGYSGGGDIGGVALDNLNKEPGPFSVGRGVQRRGGRERGGKRGS